MDREGGRRLLNQKKSPDQEVCDSPKNVRRTLYESVGGVLQDQSIALKDWPLLLWVKAEQAFND